MALLGANNGDGSSYHYTPQQWFQADRIMQEQASYPHDARDDVPVVVKNILKNCSFGTASKKPTFNGIKKRYKTHFLGLKQPLLSLVEGADNVMALVAMEQLRRTPSQLVAEIKDQYFADSSSELHTPEGILHRYRTIKTWIAADLYMDSASRRKFTIGRVVDYVKVNYFSADSKILPAQIQERYCRKFLRIRNSSEEVGKYDNNVVAEACATAVSPRSSTFRTATPLSQGQAGTDYSSTPQDSTYATPQDAQSVPSSAVDSPQPLPQIYDRSGINPHKRRRPTSLDTTNTFSTYQSSGPASIASSSRPHELVFRQRLRDSGFYSASTAGSTDSRSLISRMSRLSIDFKVCMEEHFGLTADNPCFYCGFPDAQPKPIVFLAREYASPQHLEAAKMNETNNGMQTMWIQE